MDKKNQKTKEMKLSDLIDILKMDLFEYNDTKEPGLPPLFRVKDATVEAQVVARTGMEAEGKISLYITQIGAKGIESSDSIFKLALTLEPLDQQANSGATIVGTTDQEQR